MIVARSGHRPARYRPRFLVSPLGTNNAVESSRPSAVEIPIRRRYCNPSTIASQASCRPPRIASSSAEFTRNGSFSDRSAIEATHLIEKVLVSPVGRKDRPGVPIADHNNPLALIPPQSPAATGCSGFPHNAANVVCPPATSWGPAACGDRVLHCGRRLARDASSSTCDQWLASHDDWPCASKAAIPSLTAWRNSWSGNSHGMLCLVRSRG